MPLLASDLYAISQGTSNHGSESCHWCNGKCNRTWIHDDPPPVPFSKIRTTAKNVSSLYVCVGCWLFRRKLTTMTYLKGLIQDRQAAVNHSLYFTETSCNAVGKDDSSHLYDKLIYPPLRFVLSLVDPGTANLLQLCVANDHPTIEKNTPLAFTLNNQPQHYTIYELEEAIKTGAEGKEPGVQTLLRFLGTYEPIYPLSGLMPQKKLVGRPNTKDGTFDGKITKKLVTPLSGTLIGAK